MAPHRPERRHVGRRRGGYSHRLPPVERIGLNGNEVTRLTVKSCVLTVHGLDNRDRFLQFVLIHQGWVSHRFLTPRVRFCCEGSPATVKG